MVKTCQIEEEISEESRCNDIGGIDAQRCRDGYLDLDIVVRCNEEALKINPKNIGALYNLGRCYIEDKDVERAEAIVRELQCLDPESYEAYVLNGHINLHRSRLGRSYESLIRAYYKATYKDKFLIYGISLFYEAIGDYTSARPWLVLLSRLGVEEHKSYEILFRTGVCLKKMNLFYSSANTFRVIVYNPFRNTYDVNAQIQMAHLYEMQSRHDLAIEALDAVKKSKEHHIITSRLYAWIEFKTGNFLGVKKRYKNDEDVRKDPYLAYLVGRIKYIEGSYLEALEKYSKIDQMDPMNGMIQNSMGCAHFQLDQFSSAKLAFSNALKINPNSLEAARNLKLAEERLSKKSKKGKKRRRNFYNLDEPLPSIENTKYLDSHVFLGGPVHTINPGEFNRILPFKTSRLELLPS